MDKLDTAPAAQAAVVNGPEGGPALDWHCIDWATQERNVWRLRQRIFKASQEGDLAKVRNLQKLMLRSRSNTLVSVRRVTQRSNGRKTAGIDGEVVLTPQGRAQLVQKIQDSATGPGTSRIRREASLLDVREIEKILPHRYPMLLIDRVIEMDGYRRAVGIKNVTYNEPFFQGHFPGQPIMPGVLQIEAMAQLAGALLMRRADTQSSVAVLLALDGVRLRKNVVPGDQLRIEVETLRLKSRTAEIKAQAGGWEPESLEAALSYEKEHGERKGAIAALETAIARKEDEE